MGRRFEDHMRKTVQRQREEGHSLETIAEWHGCSIGTVWNICEELKAPEGTERKPIGRPVGTGKIEPHMPVLLDLLREKPDATDSELAILLEDRCGVSFHSCTIGRALRRAGVTRKKKVFVASERDDEECQRDRKRFKKTIIPKLRRAMRKGRRLLCMDEFGSKTNLTRLIARAMRGEKIVSKMPGARHRNLTTVVTMDLEGIVEMGQVEGGMDGTALLTYLEKILAPSLRRGDIILMDNLSTHKERRVQEFLASIGVEVVFIPPYSPEFNPVEMVIAKIKSFLRMIEARTVELLKEAAVCFPDLFSPEECTAYYEHCGLIARSRKAA